MYQVSQAPVYQVSQAPLYQVSQAPLYQVSKEVGFLFAGGLYPIQCIRVQPSELGELLQFLKGLGHTLQVAVPTQWAHYSQYMESLEAIIESQNQPLNCANLTTDIPCHYLGYSRAGKTALWVRLREAWRVLCGKPSHAYFTREDGEYADGFFKDAYRATLPAAQVRQQALQSFNCRFDQTAYTLPVVPLLTREQAVSAGIDTERAAPWLL